MTTLSNHFIVNQTEKAIAIVTLPAMGEKKPFWVPRSKIVSMVELDTYSPLFEMVGETFRRQSIPVDLRNRHRMVGQSVPEGGGMSPPFRNHATRRGDRACSDRLLFLAFRRI
jgi:hypothetical protein